MTPIERVKKAIIVTEDRIQKIPNFAIYDSIYKQLQYLLSVLDESNSDKTKLSKIIVGHYAAREFEESDPELANVLYDCQNIAIALSEGKVIK